MGYIEVRFRLHYNCLVVMAPVKTHYYFFGVIKFTKEK